MVEVVDVSCTIVEGAADVGIGVGATDGVCTMVVGVADGVAEDAMREDDTDLDEGVDEGMRVVPEEDTT